MRTLRSKLLLYILSAVFILVSSSYAYLVYLANSALTDYAYRNSEAAARRYAGEAEKKLHSATDMVTGLARSVEALKHSGLTDRRILRDLFLGQMEAHPWILTLWLMFEPNHWDGRDGDDKFIPFVYRAAEGPVWDPANDDTVYEDDYKGDYFRIPKERDSLVILDPYSDDAGSGEKTLMTSVCVPVKTADGAFLGVLGIDMALDSFVDLLGGFSLFDSGYGAIISHNGTMVAHPDPSLIGTSVLDVETPEGIDAFRAVVDAGTPRSLTTYSKVRKENVHRNLVPIDAAGIRWVFTSTVPTRELLGKPRQVIFAIILSAAAILLISTLVVTRIAFGITRPIGDITRALEEISTGDFTRAVRVASNDEIGLLGKGFNDLTSRLRGTMIRIQESDARLAEIGKSLALEMETTSGSISRVTRNIHVIREKILEQASGVRETSTGVGQVAKNITRLDSLIEEQAAGITESSASIEEMVANIRSVTGNIEKMGGNFSELLKTAEEGKSRLHLANQRVAQISRQSQGLQETNSVISHIASQTNLLSMNAAIEAAHAGEYGRGFAVVADEIRKLAESASEQSKNTARELKSVKESIDLVVESTEETVKTFDGIFSRIQEVDLLIGEIKAAMTEQSSGSRQVLEALVHINAGTSEIRSGAGEMKTAGEMIHAEALGLSRITAEVENGIDEIGAEARKITSSVQDVSRLAEDNKKQIFAVNTELRKFRV